MNSFWKKNKKILKRVLQIGVTAVLFWYLITHTRFSEAVALFSRINTGLFAGSIGVLAAAQFAFIYAWYGVIHKLGLHVPLLRVGTIYFQSLFVNNFATFIGGDLFRGVRLNAHTGKKFETGFSLIISRYMMLYSLVIISGVSLLVFGKHLGSAVVTRSAGTGILILSVVYMVIVRVYSKAHMKKDTNQHMSLLRRITAQAVNNHIVFGEKFSFFLWILLLNILGHTTGFISVWVLGKSLGLDLSMLKIVAFMPILRLVLMIPISFNGFGLREMSFVTFMTRMGYNEAEALSMGLSKSLSTVLISLLGGTLLLIELLIRNDEKKKDGAQT